MWYRNDNQYTINYNWTEEIDGKKVKRAKVLKYLDIVKVPDSYAGSSQLTDITMEIEGRTVEIAQREISDKKSDINNLEFLRGNSSIEGRVPMAKFPKSKK